jgi:hypothetical protein
MSVIRNAKSNLVRNMLHPVMGAVMLAMLITLAGCQNNTSSGSGGTGSTGNTGSTGTTGTQINSSLNGNWLFTITATSGPAPFASVDGSISEESIINSSGQTTPMVASLQISQPSTCFAGLTLVPFNGTLSTTSLNLYSFAVNGQYVNITATSNTAGTSITGNYTVSDGCANGYTGSLIGTRYSPLTGTYAGQFIGAPTTSSMSAPLTQSSNANGDGSFPVTGTATFTGISCFTSGTLASGAGKVIGNNTKLAFTTNETSSSTVTLIGTFDAAADTITATSIQVAGGSCSGSLGTASLVN